MLTTEFITQVRDTLDENVTDQNWSSAEIVRYGNSVVTDLSRRMIDKGQGHYEVDLALLGVNARAVTQNVWEYILPARTSKVRRVFYSNKLPSTITNWSVWSDDFSTAQETREVPKMDQSNRGPGWFFAAPNAIRVKGQGVAQDLLVRVAMYPPGLFRGTLTAANTHADLDKFYLPPSEQEDSADIYSVDLREGAYINAMFAPTTTATATATTLGVSSRVIYSNANTIDGTRKHLIHVQSPWATVLELGDVVETHVPIPDDFMRLVILQVINRCFQKKRLLNDMRAIAGEIQFEMGEFRSFIKQRDMHGPLFMRSMRARLLRNDIDSDYNDTIWP